MRALIKECIELFDSTYDKADKKGFILILFLEWSEEQKLPSYLYNKSLYYKWRNPIKDLKKLSLETDIENINKSDLISCGILDTFHLEECKKKLIHFSEEMPKFIRSKIETAQVRKRPGPTKLADRTINHDLDEDTEWYFYYLSVDEKDEDREPKIIRTILKMYLNSQALLYHPEHFYTEDYIGRWHRIRNSSVYSLTFKNTSESRELHFKFYWPEKERELAVGSFTTYDKERLYSGSLVMVRKPFIVIEDSVVKDKNLRKKSMDIISLSSKSPDEKWKEIPVEIQEYLARKRRNHIKVPNSFNTLRGMGAFIEDYDILSKRNELFFDPQKPIIFISFQQTSLNLSTDIYERVQKGVELNIEIINDSLDKKYKILHRPLDKVKSDLLITKEHLKSLHRAKFFVLILRSNKQVSFSLVELGYALMNCKYIYVLYDGGIVSERFHHLKDLGQNIILDDQIRLATPMSEIRNKIIHFIQSKE